MNILIAIHPPRGKIIMMVARKGIVLLALKQ